MSPDVLLYPRLPRSDSFTRNFLLFAAGSLLIHALAFSALSQLSRPVERAAPNQPIELIAVEIERPTPVLPPKSNADEPAKVAPKIARPRVAAAKPIPPPPNATPPPPNQEAPPPSNQPPLFVGLSMSSTTTAGGVAVPVGNTLYGKSPEKASQPSDVAPYKGPANFSPIYQVDSEPQVIGEVKIPYPEEVRRQGIEGTVVMSIVVDVTGEVVAAKVLRGPHPSLNNAALAAIRRFKFRPATKNGQAVSTELKYSYTFLLD